MTTETLATEESAPNVPPMALAAEIGRLAEQLARDVTLDKRTEIAAHLDELMEHAHYPHWDWHLLTTIGGDMYAVMHAGGGVAYALPIRGHTDLRAAQQARPVPTMGVDDDDVMEKHNRESGG